MGKYVAILIEILSYLCCLETPKYVVFMLLVDSFYGALEHFVIEDAVGNKNLFNFAPSMTEN